MNNKKSTYRILAEALTFEELDKVKVSLEHLDHQKLSVSEIKDVIREAFEDAKLAAEVEAQELSHGWGDAEIENEIEWVKALNLKEFIDPCNTLGEGSEEESEEKEEEESEEKEEEESEEKED